MKTVIVNIPEKKQNFFFSLMKELKLKTQDVSSDFEEDKQLAKWIDKGMKSEDVPEEAVFAVLKKHGVKI